MNSGIRRLEPSDVPACLALAVDRGWPEEEARWRLLLEVGEGYGWVAPDTGELVGAVVLTRFGARAGVVGLMLVRSDHGGRGIGRALMERLLDEAAGSDTVFLYATDEGRPLYEKLGFRASHEVATHLGTFVPPARPGALRVQTLAPGDIRELHVPDAALLGFDRGHLLDRLAKFAREIRVVRAPDGRVTGYAAAWDNAGRTAVGPVVAPTPDVLCALVEDIAVRDRGRAVRLECPVVPDGTVRAWAVRHGLRETGRCTFMVRGRPLPDGRLPSYAPFMQSIG
ncbi:GNAT family N-acetyltransferase [Streptomyces populi]|nr:GNAT family N-acetyltransferase [Streptomyces populi]